MAGHKRSGSSKSSSSEPEQGPSRHSRFSGSRFRPENEPNQYAQPLPEGAVGLGNRYTSAKIPQGDQVLSNGMLFHPARSPTTGRAYSPQPLESPVSLSRLPSPESPGSTGKASGAGAGHRRSASPSPSTRSSKSSSPFDIWNTSPSRVASGPAPQIDPRTVVHGDDHNPIYEGEKSWKQLKKSQNPPEPLDISQGYVASMDPVCGPRCVPTRSPTPSSPSSASSRSSGSLGKQGSAPPPMQFTAPRQSSGLRNSSSPQPGPVRSSAGSNRTEPYSTATSGRGSGEVNRDSSGGKGGKNSGGSKGGKKK